MKTLLVATLGALLFTPRVGLAQTSICHVPPDTNPQVITVDDDAVDSHLAHGDCRGDCSCLRTSTCSAKTVHAVHAKNKEIVLGNARLSRIENGKVACLHVDGGSKADCVFRRTSGAWVETADGDYALAGQAISLDGRPDGEYVVASQVGPGLTVPCVDPSGRDTVGTAAGEELAVACSRETLNSPANHNQSPLVNYATLEVCTSSYPHPDGAMFTRMLGTSFCYIGTGAALNDINGTERDQTGAYLPGALYCHVVYNGAYETTGAKRPATAAGYPVKLNINTPILWRPVASIRVAN